VKQPATPSYAGIDWATSTHAVCVVDPAGVIRARFEVPNTGKRFTGLIKRLTKLQVARVAIERPDGPLVGAMLAAGLAVGGRHPTAGQGAAQPLCGLGGQGRPRRRLPAG
jgi:transposase